MITRKIYFFALFAFVYTFQCSSFGIKLKPPEKPSEEKKASESEGPKKELKENVVFEAVDKGNSDPAADRMIYYKIYLNKELTLKTPPGLFFQKKTIETKLEPGRYLFFAERWYLDEESNAESPEYKRANNVWQMKPVYLDIPEEGGSVKAVFGIDHDKNSVYLDVISE